MKQWVLTGLGWVLVLCAIVAGILLLTNPFAKNPIPTEIRNRVHFATYYPRSLPDGYYIKQESYEVTSGVLVYIIQTPDDSQITVTQQSPPDTFDFNNFHTKQLQNTRTTTTRDKQPAYLGTIENNTVASVRTADSWVLITANKKAVPLEQLESIAKTMTI